MSIALSPVYDEERTYEDGQQHADDKRLLVRFDIRAVKNEYLSNKEGRPIFQDEEYIQIIVPGSRDVMTAPLDETYKRRFADRYKRWKEDTNRVQHIVGTPLAEVSWMTRSQVAELAMNNVYTVENLADMSDIDAMKFMGSHELRKRAKNFLQAAANEAPLTRLQQELEQRDNHIKTLEQKLEAMQAALDKLSTKKG